MKLAIAVATIVWCFGIVAFCVGELWAIFTQREKR
jgi:hypothetical protein